MVQLLRPGPHGMSLPSREELEVRVKELLRTLQTTSNWFESKMAINNLLGSSSFTLGAVAGMTRSLVVSAHDLACLANTLALAEYYDLSHSPSLWRRIQSRMMFTSSAGAAFLVGNLAAAGWSMQQMTAMASNAHKERQALFDLLADVFGNPSPFFDQLKSDMSETYQAFMGHLGSHSLSGNFKAGELFGELLLNVLLIADGITAAAKLISAAPRLLQNLARLKRLVQRMPGSGVKAAEEVVAGVAEAKTPSQMVKKPPAEVKPVAETGANGGGKVLGELTGTPTRIPAAADASEIRSLTRENQSAEILANGGFKVEQNPTVVGPKNPDYRINGEVFDNYAPASSSVRNIASNIEEKVIAGQTNNVVVNLADSSATPAALRAQLTNYPVSGLKQVIIIDKSGSFTIIKF
jgi:hypothetical protein